MVYVFEVTLCAVDPVYLLFEVLPHWIGCCAVGHFFFIFTLLPFISILQGYMLQNCDRYYLTEVRMVGKSYLNYCTDQ